MTLTRDRAQELLTAFGQQRILVVGDLMLDRYIYGLVRRISPEAPVPVVDVHEEKNMPGGASNVAWNIQSVGGHSVVGGTMGDDAAGNDLRRLLGEGGVSVSGVYTLPKARTTVKTRIIAERQQVVRVDWEDELSFTETDLASFRARLDQEVRSATGVIIEDYGKGVVCPSVVEAVIRAAASAGVPIGYDPKENHDLDVRGVTLATPNRREAYLAAGVPEPRHTAPAPLKDDGLLQVGRILLKKWGVQQLLITLGAQGMLLLEAGAPPRHIPTRAREVFDVSGAGDTVIALSLLALASGASFHEAAELANYAAGVVVAKLGTATCSPEELLGALA